MLPVPANVREVCRVLAGAGFEAVTVGGAVRDALLGRDPGDWDVATSAHPEQVLKLFRHTIPTGLQHGTVTVVTGKGAHTHVEVTTFRGEGAYTDARRPDHVVFGVPLIEDLARRDLTVNAMAYDPATDALIDPFGGQADVAAKTLRAVGNAVERFTEDGLRVMRAVRFAAQLEFTLDPATEAGIGPALPSLAKVSRERVCEELRKILETNQPSRGLVPAIRTGIMKTVLPDVEIAVERVDRATVRTRLAALMAPLASPDALPVALDRGVQKRVGEILRALKFSNVELEVASHLVAVAHASRELSWTAPDVRRVLAQLRREQREMAIELWATYDNPGLVSLARTVLADPLEVGDLALTGKQLMDALQMPPGPAVGRILGMLLQYVLDDPSVNTKDALIARAQTLELEVGR